MDVLVALIGLAGAMAAGGLVGWVARGRPPVESAEPPSDEGPQVAGLDPDLLWALVEGEWVAMERSGGTWVPAIRDPSVEVTAGGFPPLVRWARALVEQPVVQDALDQWTEACVACSRVAWVTGVPTGDQLLQAWARSARPTEDPGTAFAVWLVGSLGKAGRSGLASDETARQRAPVILGLHRAAARVIQAVEPSLVLELECPAGVGPRQAERWLADRSLAEVLGSAVAGEVIEPMVVLRPALLRGEDVLLEGEVA